MPEVVVALMILAIISSTVVMAINRYSEMAIDQRLKVEAFHLARENMEKLLASDSVEETLNYSSSDLNPDIQSQSVIETFYEPRTKRMWIRAVCSASYTDSQDQQQTVEFTHWVTDLSAEQMLKVLEAREWQRKQATQNDDIGDDAEDYTDDDQDDQDGEDGEDSPDGENTTTTTSKSGKDRSTTTTSRPPFDWLPENWYSMSHQEQLDWLLRSLMSG